MSNSRSNPQKEEQPPKGLKKLLGQLFGQKSAPSEDEDDFRPLVALVPRTANPKVQGAHAPSRTVVAAAAAAPKTDAIPLPDEEEERRPRRESPENRVLIRGSKLYELYCRMNGAMPYAKKGSTFNLSLLMPKDHSPDAQQRNILQAIEREARALSQYAPPRKNPEKPDEAPPALPVDAFAFVRVSDDKMTAYLFILPPLNGGQPLPMEWIYRLLVEKKVDTGIDDEAIRRACEDEKHLQLLPIAHGIPPEPGQDGEIVDYYSREIEIQLTVQDDNTIDFKDLGWLQTVREGEIICDVLKPTQGIPGLTVQGQTVAPYAGRDAVPPVGPGTHLSEDGTALLASMDGVLTFIGGGFRVDPLLIVKGDVDNGIGNLDVVGDILVYGDIREGFSVSASGSITVQGMVEGAHIKAGGDVRISLGINGNQSGCVEAEGSLLCKFIENATVTTGGQVVCESIVHSTVHSNTSISAMSGRGVIIGGEVRALESIEALVIGSEQGRMLTAILGATTTVLEEMEEVEARQQALEDEILDKEKNIAYLAPVEEALSYSERVRLDDLRQGLKVQRMQLSNLKRRADILARKQQDYSRCSLKASTLHPPMQLIIGNIAAELRQSLEHVVVRRSEDEIIVESSHK